MPLLERLRYLCISCTNLDEFFEIRAGTLRHAQDLGLAPGPDGEPLWRDAWELAHPGEPHAPTVGLRGGGAAAQAFTFDYVCVSPALAARVRSLHVDTGATGSDHQPLLLELA